MPKKQPTQRTEKGLEIPIPSRGQVLGDLAKTASPQKSKRKQRKR
jgi:hypothetical protein